MRNPSGTSNSPQLNLVNLKNKKSYSMVINWNILWITYILRVSNLCSSWFGNILLQDHECQKCKFGYHEGIVPDNLKNPLMLYLIEICFNNLFHHSLCLFHAQFIYKFIGKTYTYAGWIYQACNWALATANSSHENNDEKTILHFHKCNLYYI